MNEFESTLPISAKTRNASLAIAAVAWVILVVAIYVHEPDSILIGIVGFPVIYAVSLGMCWGISYLALTTEPSGPWKNLQLKYLREPFVVWCNAMAIIFPLSVLVAALLGLFGILPTKE